MTATEAPPTVDVLAVVAAARTALGNAPGRAAWMLGTVELGEAARAALALRAQADGLLLDVVRAAGARGVPTECGARDLPGWLASVGRLDRPAARELVELAGRIDPGAVPQVGGCPATAGALRAGGLDLAQARVIAAAMGALPGGVAAEAGLAARAEECLVEAAGTLGPRELTVAARGLRETLTLRVGACDVEDPGEAARVAAAAELAEAAAYAARSVRTKAHLSGLTQVTMLLPVEVAAGLLTGLGALGAPRPEDDGLRDERSRAQRHADAVEELVGLALDAGRLPERGGERPQLSVTLSYETLPAGRERAGLLDTGEALHPGTLRRLLCDAAVLPVVLGGRSQPLDLGRAARTFDRYQRRALLVRDGGCAGLGCEAHPVRTQAHHLREWEHGGGTDLGNGALFCPSWHRRIHTEGWEVRLGANGHPELVPPAWVDPARRPRQNHRFRQPVPSRGPVPKPRT